MSASGCRSPLQWRCSWWAWCTAFGGDVKRVKHLTDSEVSLLAEASNLGFCVGPHIGVFVDRFGPRTGALVAAILTATATAKSLESPAWSFEATAAMFVLVGQSSSLAYMSAIAAYKGFLPANRGKVIGVLDGAFGLSLALFSAIYALHFSPRVGSFFLLVAGCLFGVSLLGHQPYTHLQPATPVHVTAVH